MICPECNGKGEAIYYVETDRDENTVTVEQRKGICRTCNGSGVKAPTNADRIRAMSDEELAYLFAHETYRILEPLQNHIGYGITENAIYARRLKWLKQPADMRGEEE